uniref:BACK domain-containing protein n=1 Tax=Tetradesmus obliquus TaxID=3088 RepID=A0A383WIC5_TETOB|eukprot:jgi/Sobl393_1/8335/SZX76972.1
MAPATMSCWYRRQKFADVKVVIIEIHDSGNDVGTILDIVPAHRLVLYEQSTFLQAKLDNWKSSDDSIQLEVPPGQLKAGQLLLQCMYDSPNFQLQQVPQQQLLELLLLADKYGASAVAAAAAAELGSKPAEQLEWQVVVRLFELQHHTAHGLALLPGYAAALAAGAVKLQAVLGDLELAWQVEESAQALRQLPFALLLRLLSDPQTRVASEDTVVYALDQWLAAQQQQQQQQQGVVVTEDKLAQLVQHIRMPRCSPLFLTTVLPSTPWLLRHVPPQQLPLATTLAVLPSLGPARQAITGHSEVLAALPAWQLPTRPASAVRSLQLDLRVPVAQVRQLVEQGLKTAAAAAAAVPAPDSLLAARSCQGAGAAVTSSSFNSSSSGESTHSVSSPVAVWCGKRFQLQLEFGSSRKLAVVLLMLPSMDSMRAPSHTDIDQAEGRRPSAGQQQLMPQQLAAVQCSLCAVRFGVQEACRKADKPRSLVAGKGRRWADFFGLGEVCSWEAVRAGLGRQHLMSVAAGELHIRATLTKVW